nr:ATP-dependent helicase C-terminal domain-containing protein [Brevibacillus composti]
MIALAFPDRIAQRRESGRYFLSNGRGAVLPSAQAISGAPYLAAAELDDQGSESKIYLAAPLELDEVERAFADQIEEERVVYWDSGQKSVRARLRKKLGALILRESSITDLDTEETVQALLSGIAAEGLELLPWSKQARQLQRRLQFLHLQDPSHWPDVSDDSLRGSLSDWLGPHIGGMKSVADLQRLALSEILLGLVSWEQRRELEKEAPSHIEVPSGSRIPIDYTDPAAPVLAVRLQEMFGLTDTPRIWRGRVPLTLHLLSPAQRPVQVTRDLSSFWKTTYFEVKKDLKGRYPKHYWPDDPMQAAPTNRTRPRL